MGNHLFLLLSFQLLTYFASRNVSHLRIREKKRFVGTVLLYSIHIIWYGTLNTDVALI